MTDLHHHQDTFLIPALEGIRKALRCGDANFAWSAICSGVEQGFVTPDEVPQLYSDEITRARTSLFARRYGIWATLIVAWSAWLTIGQGITFWTPAIFVALILMSIFAPIRHILGAARFKAELRRLTP